MRACLLPVAKLVMPAMVDLPSSEVIPARRYATLS